MLPALDPVAPGGLPPVPQRPAGRLLRYEVLVVLAVSLGADAVRALVSFVGDLTSGTALAHQQATIAGSLAPGRPWLDLAFQLVDIATGLAPVALVGYLLARSSEGFAPLGVDRSQPRRDLARGAAVAAVIGGAGLGLYLLAVAAGANLTVVPADLPAVWWRIPVEVLIAAQNGILEEIVVGGYLLHRLSQLGYAPRRAIATSAVLRGSYHLYQGLGGFAGNLVMGVLFALLYRRWGRVAPLVVAHTLIDVGALVGYTLLAGHVGWLPR